VLGVEHTVIESVELEVDGRGGDVLIAAVSAHGRGGVTVLALRSALSGL
jgi:hypothetical protein